MRFKLNVDLPTAAEIIDGLDLHAVHPGLSDAEVTERQRAQDLEDVRIALARAVTNVSAVAAEVQSGARAVSDLDAAVVERQAQALRIAPAEAAVQAAVLNREKAQAKARERLRSEAVRRNRRLEETAAEVSNLLASLTSLELALESHATQALGTPANLPAVTWPMSLRDQNIDYANRRVATRG